MRRIFGYLGDMLVAFLPEDYRPEWAPRERDLVRPCIAGGLGLTLVLFSLLVESYVRFMSQALDRMAEGPSILENPVLLGAGVFSFFEYAFHPYRGLLVYYFVETVFRVFVAVTVGSVNGTLPLHVVNWGHRLVSPHYEEWAMGPRIIDRVKKVEGKPYDLLVASCRRKPTWDTYNTISYEDELYEVLKEVDSHPPHRFLYELRKKYGQ